MASLINIKKLGQVKARLTDKNRQVYRRMTVGLTRAGLWLQRASQQIVPVDTGNLKASAFTRSEGDNTAAVKVFVGYTANYALYVHENLDALHGADFNAAYADKIAGAKSRRKKGRTGHDPFGHSRGENQQAKFLERPMREGKTEMQQVLLQAMRTK